MSAYTNLQRNVDKKIEATDLEMCVLYCGDPMKYDISYINTEAAAAELAAKDARLEELEARNKWWLENFDITMPCGHKNRYLDVNAKGELVRDENGDAVCTMCIVEAQ